MSLLVLRFVFYTFYHQVCTTRGSIIFKVYALQLKIKVGCTFLQGSLYNDREYKMNENYFENSGTNSVCKNAKN